MRIVYVDVLFMTNLAINYLLLVLTARLSGVYAGRLRLLGGGALGALFAVVLYFPALPPLAAGLTRILLCAAIAVVAFHKEPPRVIARICLVFVACSFALAGGILALAALGAGGVSVSNGVPYFNLSLRLLLCATIAIYAVLGLVFGSGGMGVRRKTVELEIFRGGQSLRLKGFADTGNLLREPMSGKPVIVVSQSALGRLFPGDEAVQTEVTDQFAALSQRWPGCFRLTPCKTAAAKRGMMLTAKVDRIVMDGREVTGYWVGFAPEEIETQGGCRAIVGV